MDIIKNRLCAARKETKWSPMSIISEESLANDILHQGDLIDPLFHTRVGILQFYRPRARASHSRNPGDFDPQGLYKCITFAK